MKKIKQFDPFKNLVLDDEEQAIENALERGEYVSLPNLEETKAMLKDAAIRYQELNSSKPVTLRINQLDLIKLKAKAKEKKIPYQTLISALIHQYAEDKTEIVL